MAEKEHADEELESFTFAEKFQNMKCAVASLASGSGLQGEGRYFSGQCGGSRSPPPAPCDL